MFEINLLEFTADEYNQIAKQILAQADDARL